MRMFFRGSAAQQENIERVHAKIAPAIIAFFRMVGPSAQFHVDELRVFVERHHPYTAPDSAGRIMRDLRERGVIDYEVVNRAASLYQVTRVT